MNYDEVFDRMGHEACAGVEILTNLEIECPDDLRMPMHVYRPVNRPAEPAPAMVCFHGGGFRNGDPAGSGALGKYLALTMGMTVFAATYRLFKGEGSTFPAAIQDAAEAWRWVHRHAAEWNIDPKRVAIGGDSAGGCISSLVTLTQHRPDLAGGGRTGGEPILPGALAVYWGPLDFVARWYDNGENPGAERDFFGANFPDNPEIYHRASALTHVRAGLPPALFVYGRQDPVVHPRQGRLAHAAWQAHGNHSELYVLENIGHGTTGNNREQRERCFAKTAEFLKWRMLA